MKLLFALVVLVAVASASRVFLEASEPLPLRYGWTEARLGQRVAHARLATETREVVFMVRQQNLEKLEQLFWDVSLPESPHYGQHRNLAEIREIVQPTQEAINAVTLFLESHGVTELSWALTNDMVSARIPLNTLARMFDVQFRLYEHPSGERAIATLDAYSVPEEVAQHLDFVAGVSGLPDIDESEIMYTAEDVIRRNQRIGYNPEMPGNPDAIDPDVIRARYNCSSVLVGPHPNNSHAVAEFQFQSYAPSDLQKFFTKYVTNSDQDTVAKVIGANDAQRPGLEASLDIEYAMGVAPNLTTWFYGMKQFNFYADLVRWLKELNSEDPVPWVHSVSYGSQGDYPSQTYMDRSDAEYQKLGARGVTIIYASGDSGAECEEHCTVMYASYPATSVFVTATGATRFEQGNSGPEAAVQAFKSGGGFSSWDAAPTWQQAPIAAYLASGVKFPPATAFNSNNRCNPDFAALGSEEFEVVIHGVTTLVGGTSASAPTFAAVMSLLNDIRLTNGEGTLGFANPLLYGFAENNPGAFFDVTVGNNEKGCSFAPCGAGNIDGYMCAPGYDAVTGFGTPNYAVLSTLV